MIFPLPLVNVSKRALLVIFLFLAIAFINFFAFYPSFSHAARADQTILLIETADIDHFSDLVSYTYSYPRHRVINSGDSFLFRPVLYVLFALEKWFFGFNFTYWQVTGFLLHLFVVWQLLKVLFLIRASFLAGFFVLGFSVSYIAQEMVIWHHISGYLLCLIFLLEALYFFIRYLHEDRKSFWRLVMIAGYLTLACFTYELGVICAFFFASALLFCKKGPVTSRFPWKEMAVLFAPIVIYACVNFLDYVAANQTMSMGGSLEKHPHFTNFVLSSLSVLALTLFGGSLPYFISILPGIRLVLLPLRWEDVFMNKEMGGLGCSLNTVLVSLIVLALGWGIIQWTRNKISNGGALKRVDGLQKENTLVVIFITTSILLSYVFVIAARSSLHWRDAYFSSSLYNFYITGLFLTISLYCLFSLYFDHLAQDKEFSVLVVTIFCLSSLLNATKVCQMYIAMKNAQEPWGLYIKRLERFINAHKHEPGFSYYLLQRPDGGITDFTIGSPQEGHWREGDASDLFFRKYVNADNPRYYLVYFDKSGIFSFKNKEEADHFLNSSREYE